MHAKTATIDGTWSTIGSYNFDSQSRFSNLEVTVEILDPATSARQLVRHVRAVRRELRSVRRGSVEAPAVLEEGARVAVVPVPPLAMTASATS